MNKESVAVLTRIPTTCPKEAIGNARATAAETSSLETIANAVAKIAPDTVSGGVAEPIPTTPIIINSNEPPTIIPVVKSPKINPTNGPNTSGRSIIHIPPTLLSQIPIPPSKPSSNACTILIRLPLSIY